MHQRLAAFAVVSAVSVLPACSVRAGIDAASHINGPLHALQAAATVNRSDGVTNLPTQDGRNYTVEAGFGTSKISVNALVAVHDVTSNSFTPGAGYLATTFGANVRWNILDWHGLSPSIAAGPARMMLLDRQRGDAQWGNAMRFGGGAQYKLGPVAVYADLYREIVAFGDSSSAAGNTTLDGITIGVALTP